MTAKSPADRPTATTLLQMTDVFSEGDAISMVSNDDMLKRDRQIEAQAETIQAQAVEIAHLRRELLKLKNIE
ncbi:hypothetical protein SARC_10028 [Sphaeroforma arctica JP610]|uniref:Uncharacterized protein n=1 Tax=Sphaeroforma arctica JP610 TaxID=667725 RepID=A0A0L0FL77_9EUKA|nr:hypothetical protein SARC_10028 [Sphaeroforma arctica JP610]KNC77515.1 hypothetical protein SARC_10028 [Sphaeroforma arctica JP610]|eukprot:XP_014151417.1 hypothetical protein SARC_10028 [Sphaeroforma arctica JP610]